VHARLWRRRTPQGRSRLGKRVCQSTSRLLHEIVVRGDRQRLNCLNADGVILPVTPLAWDRVLPVSVRAAAKRRRPACLN
jgi:hypothetical protein